MAITITPALTSAINTMTGDGFQLAGNALSTAKKKGSRRAPGKDIPGNETDYSQT